MDSTTQSLLTLLPTYDTSTLPTQLTNLATSLYAQSRTKAANLKSEEEVARGFAVSEIACHRLRNRLNLPKPQSRPPCAPKVYKKLYQYLDNALPAKTARTTDATPTKTRPAGTGAQRSESSNVNGSLRTPQRRGQEAENPTRTPNSIAGRKRKVPEPEAIVEDRQLDIKIRRAAQVLCDSTDAADSDDALHVFVGAKTIVQQESRPTGDGRSPGTSLKSPRSKKAMASSPEDQLLYGVVIAVFAVVCVQTKIGQSTEVALVEDAIQILTEAEMIDQTQNKPIRKEAETLLKDRSEEWKAMEWFQNLLAQGDDMDEDGDHEDGSNQKQGQNGETMAPNQVLYGLGTMRQAKTDWLSEEKRLAYAKWKASILEQLDAAEREQTDELTGD